MATGRILENFGLLGPDRAQSMGHVRAKQYNLSNRSGARVSSREKASGRALHRDRIGCQNSQTQVATQLTLRLSLTRGGALVFATPEIGLSTLAPTAGTAQPDGTVRPGYARSHPRYEGIANTNAQLPPVIRLWLNRKCAANLCGIEFWLCGRTESNDRWRRVAEDSGVL